MDNYENELHDVLEQSAHEVSTVLGPLTVLASPFTYILEYDPDDPSAYGATDLFVLGPDKLAIKLRIQLESLTDEIKVGDTLIAVAGVQVPCSAAIEVHELYKIVDGTVFSLYRWQEIKSVNLENLESND
jgi:hypothetical protein